MKMKQIFQAIRDSPEILAEKRLEGELGSRGAVSVRQTDCLGNRLQIDSTLRRTEESSHCSGHR